MKRRQKVFSSNESLILLRSVDICGTTWLTGPNAGRCSSMKSGYKGEFCIDNFKIPDDHLKAFYLWNATHPIPKAKFHEGKGVDSDYILYVRSWTSPKCISAGANVIAYASYCRLDLMGRPIAGYMNICPFVFNNPSFTDSRLYQVILHELLHALGFSSDLFSSFRNCSVINDTLSCAQHRTPTVIEDDGVKRFVSPKVSQLTKQHFNCHTNDDSILFGPILQVESGFVKSHWDAAFMYSSIMSPLIEQFNETVIDPITLAFFEDTGWYKVNYDYAENFVWGRDSGCHFAMNSSSYENDKEYFCILGESLCHHLHRAKGICHTDEYLRGFPVIKSHTDCMQLKAADDRNLEMFEIYGDNSRCFMSNISTAHTDVLKPVCYRHKCTSTRELMLFINNIWMPCPYGGKVQVMGMNGIIVCPKVGILCSQNIVSTDEIVLVPSNTQTNAIIIAPHNLSAFSSLSCLLFISITCIHLCFAIVHSV